MLSIQDLLSGEIVKPRQQAQANPMEGIGTLLSFLAQGNVGMPQLPQMSGGGSVDASAIMQMLADKRKTDKTNKQQEEAQAYRQKILGTPGTDRIPTPLLDARDATNGTGFLGGELDPTQTMAMLAQAKDPTTASAGLAMLNDQFQPRGSGTLQHVTMGAPGKEGWLQNAILTPDGTAKPIGEPWKQSSGVNVYTGNGTQMVPATAEDKAVWGIDPRIPATKNNKTGEVVAHPVTTTEDQGKTALYFSGLKESNESINSILDAGYNMKKPAPQNYIGSKLHNSGIPIISDLGNTIQDDNSQILTQASDQFLTNMIHILTGAGFTASEAELKARSYLPEYGDSAEKLKQKRLARESIISGAIPRAGIALPAGAKPTTTESGQVVKPALSPSTRAEIEAELRRRGLLK